MLETEKKAMKNGAELTEEEKREKEERRRKFYEHFKGTFEPVEGYELPASYYRMFDPDYKPVFDKKGRVAPT